MKIVCLILVLCTILFAICSGGSEPQLLSVIMDKTEHTFCIDVKNVSIEDGEKVEVPKATLWLDVDYPFDVAEAGHAFMDNLSIGLHNISYKYLKTFMTHDLLVKVDGVETEFTKSDVPRWTSVSTFREVNLVLVGPIQLLDCEGQPELQDVLQVASPVVVEPTLSEPKGSFFIFDSHEDAQNSVDETYFKDEMYHLKILTNSSTERPKLPVSLAKPITKNSTEDGNDAVLKSKDVPNDKMETEYEDGIDTVIKSKDMPNGKTKTEIEDGEDTVFNSNNVQPDKMEKENKHISFTKLNSTDSQSKDIAVTKTNTTRTHEIFPDIAVTKTNTTRTHEIFADIAVIKANTTRTHETFPDIAVIKANTTRTHETFPEKPSPPFSETIEENNFTDTFSLNHSAFETNWSESRVECGKRNCEKEFSHDYTIAFILFGILGAIALIAAVISIVFHRKKKKLMVSGRDRPGNRLRQKLQEESLAGGEYQLMLKDIENTYEEIR